MKYAKIGVYKLDFTQHLTVKKDDSGGSSSGNIRCTNKLDGGHLKTNTFCILSNLF